MFAMVDGRTCLICTSESESIQRGGWADSHSNERNQTTEEV